jgi:hypothetical protein
VRVSNRDENVEYIGERMVWGEYRPFGLQPKDRKQHVYCIGKSGTGKTTLLRNLLIQDIAAGRGVALVDVHGDLAEELLDYIPPHRTDDVVYFRPGDESHPMGLNLFDRVAPDARHLVTSGVVGAFKSIALPLVPKVRLRPLQGEALFVSAQPARKIFHRSTRTPTLPRPQDPVRFAQCEVGS